MAKILYIPNGRFLSFSGSENISEANLEYVLSCTLRADLRSHDIWFNKNNITYPILREELEIIYD